MAFPNTPCDCPHGKMKDTHGHLRRSPWLQASPSPLLAISALVCNFMHRTVDLASKIAPHPGVIITRPGFLLEFGSSLCETLPPWTIRFGINASLGCGTADFCPTSQCAGTQPKHLGASLQSP